MEFSTEGFQERIEKPWGYELIYTPKNLSRVGKILFVRAGKKLSLQYHDEKEETLCLFSGEAILWIENANGEIEKKKMELKKGYTVYPMQKHRVETVADSFLIEVSLPETGKTVRLEDSFGRSDETEEMRGMKNRGWKE